MPGPLRFWTVAFVNCCGARDVPFVGRQTITPPARSNSVIRPGAVGDESNPSSAQVRRRSAYSQALDDSVRDGTSRHDLAPRGAERDPHADLTRAPSDGKTTRHRTSRSPPALRRPTPLTVDSMLTSDYRVCAGRRCVGAPRCFMENRVRDGIRSGGIGGEPRRFWRRTHLCEQADACSATAKPPLKIGGLTRGHSISS